MGLMVMCSFEGIVPVMILTVCHHTINTRGKIMLIVVGVDILVYQHEGTLYFIFRHVTHHALYLISCSKGTHDN